MNNDDISTFSDAASKALVDVRKRLNLPQHGYIVFPYMYCAKNCFHLDDKLSSQYKKLAYKYAFGMFILGGPHLYFFLKTLETNYMNVLFSAQILLFLVYFIKRRALLNKAKKLECNYLPISIYTERIAAYVKKKTLINILFGFLVIFGGMGGFLVYSVFIKGYYLMFLFLLGLTLWLSAGGINYRCSLNKIF
jgi:hypothetical protein